MHHLHALSVEREWKAKMIFFMQTLLFLVGVEVVNHQVRRS